MTDRTFFEGKAGSGKTTAIIDTLAAFMRDGHLHAEKRILALTFMHGARRRLHSKLDRIPGLRNRFDCITFDSFTLGLIARWKSLVRHLIQSEPDTKSLDFDLNAKIAALVLDRECVRDWLRRSYGMLVVDEAQDVHGPRLGLLKRLCEVLPSVLGADDFQDLTGAVDSEECLSWLRASNSVVRLDGCHRTHDDHILGAAAAIRAGHTVNTSASFQLISVPNATYAVHCVARYIHTGVSREVVILTPVRRGTSAFVDQIVARLGEKQILLKKIGPVGPYRFRWEFDVEEVVAQVSEALALDSITALGIERIRELAHGATRVLRSVAEDLLRTASLTGTAQFTPEVVAASISKCAQRHRAFGALRRGKRIMTIHQAKNQEFDTVVVLWPYQVGGTEDRLRRLLYNAVTRSKLKVTVLVEDPKGYRVKQPPFAPALIRKQPKARVST